MSDEQLSPEEVARMRRLIKSYKATPDPAADVSKAWEAVKGWGRSLSLVILAVILLLGVKYGVTDPEIKTAMFKPIGLLIGATGGYWAHRIITKIRPHQIEDMALRIEANRVRAMYVAAGMLSYALL